jgi:hypothetical protein
MYYFYLLTRLDKEFKRPVESGLKEKQAGQGLLKIGGPPG